MLTPPDLERCQAEKPNGQSFMTLGGGHAMVRCDARPSVIARERIPGADGLRGAMSLCASCAAVMVRQCGPDFADQEPI